MKLELRNNAVLVWKLSVDDVSVDLDGDTRLIFKSILRK